MFVCVHTILFFFVISPAVSSVVRNLASIPACSNQTDVDLHRRVKRQSLECRSNQWSCKDGTCIDIGGACDGTVDCPDGSDETHALCRQIRCRPNWFRCTYGACVDGSAACNGVVECRDESDELVACSNKTTQQNEDSNTTDRYRCLDGDTVPTVHLCDGIAHCPDGSDETVRACASHKCPSYLFQCAYGACVDKGSECNGVNQCADGSDEDEDLCTKPTAPPTNKNKLSQPGRVTGKCILPSYPQNGRYVVTNARYAKPQDSLPSALLNITCDPGYEPEPQANVFCHSNIWSAVMPKCVRFCKLEPHPSVSYRCVVPDLKGFRACKPKEPSGTWVEPKCNRHYVSGHEPGYMKCEDGVWNKIVTCNADCGQLTPVPADGLIAGPAGRKALRGELPWYVGIYAKEGKYKQICGGSLVSHQLVISAAHCFWDDVANKAYPASMYAVALAKLYRNWDNSNDKDAQKFDIQSIEIPVAYGGVDANFQQDIAVVILKKPVVYHNYVRPVCLDFNVTFNEKQLRPENSGKVAGWGAINEKGQPSKILRVVDLPFVDLKICIDITPKSFRASITGDKICAGYTNGTALCVGDSGSGLAFPENERGIDRYYLRGVASTAPRGEDNCNPNTVTTFTEILKHERFIKDFL